MLRKTSSCSKSRLRRHSYYCFVALSDRIMSQMSFEVHEFVRKKILGYFLQAFAMYISSGGILQFNFETDYIYHQQIELKFCYTVWMLTSKSKMAETPRWRTIYLNAIRVSN